MNNLQIPFRLRLKVAARTVLRVCRRPGYLLLALAAAFVTWGLIIWSMNLNVLWYVWTQTGLGAVQKLQFLLYGYSGFLHGNLTLLAAMVLVTALLGGVTAALLLKVLRQRWRLESAGGTGAALGLAVLSGGCAACGTSLFAPLLSIFGATSAAAAHSFGVVMLLISSALLLSSIYRLALMIMPETTA